MFHAYINLTYAHIHVIHRVHQAEYIIYFLVAKS